MPSPVAAMLWRRRGITTRRSPISTGHYSSLVARMVALIGRGVVRSRKKEYDKAIADLWRGDPPVSETFHSILQPRSLSGI